MRHLSLLTLSMLLISCGNAPAANERFGEFGYQGKYLTSFGKEKITSQEARLLLPSLPRQIKPRFAVKPHGETVDGVLSRFASVHAEVFYYLEGQEEQQVWTGLVQGTDFRYILQQNVYCVFGQMTIDYLLMDAPILDEMDQANAEFSSLSSPVPFKEPYTYHRSATGNLVVQTHRFSELSSSEGGGIGSTFRQDCETLYDAEGKMSKWQSSLGLFISTPTGTTRQGYIFEASFSWDLK